MELFGPMGIMNQANWVEATKVFVRMITPIKKLKPRAGIKCLPVQNMSMLSNLTVACGFGGKITIMTLALE